MTTDSRERPPTVAVINATPASVGPAKAAIAAGFPEATVWSLLDDRLVTDAEAAGGLTPQLSDRMATLISYAVQGGADAILLACSMYGPVLDSQRQTSSVPMLSSDEELFAEVARCGFGSVLLLGPLPPAVQDSVDRLRKVLAGSERSSSTEVVGKVASGAPAAVAGGDVGALEKVLAAAASPHLKDVDAVILANFSLAPARAGLERTIRKPVLSPPLLAAAALRARVVGEESVGLR
jgi:Asp/Glu/hydantoin racemase